MQFAHGLYVGASSTYHYVFRFDQELGVVSGERRLVAEVPAAERDNPTTPPEMEFLAAGPSVPDDGRPRYTLAESPNQLVLTGKRTLTFTRQPNLADLDLRSVFEFLGLTEEDRAVLRQASATGLRRIEVVVNQVGANIPGIPASVAAAGKQIGLTESFAEAGIDVTVRNPTLTIDPQHSRTEWSDNDLGTLLHAQLGVAEGTQSWQVHLLIANRHSDGLEIRGSMFDRKARQGTAVFVDALADGADISAGANSGAPNRSARTIRTLVHELGHALNLVHCCDSDTNARGRCAAMSFMNVPENYAGTIPNYWANFQWVFDPGELFFLRHGRLQDIIFGGKSNFAGLVSDGVPRGHLAPRSHPRFRLLVRDRRRTGGSGPRSGGVPVFEFGEPVHLEAKLVNQSRSARALSLNLDPRAGLTIYYVRRPNGTVRPFRPLMRHCTAGNTVVGPGANRALYSDVFLSYGADGYTFAEPGLYEVVAVARTPAGPLTSKPCRLWVRYPDRATETAVVPTLTDSVGEFIALEGADAVDHVKATADEVEGRVPRHPLVAGLKARLALQESRGYWHLTRRGSRSHLTWIEPVLDAESLGGLVGLDPMSAAAPVSNIMSGRLATKLWEVLRTEKRRKRADVVRESTLGWLKSAGMSGIQLKRFTEQAFYMNRSHR
jgi:hypothetical protein